MKMEKLHTREQINGKTMSQDTDLVVVDLFFNAALFEAIRSGGTYEEGTLVCVHWEDHQFYLSSVSLLSRDEENDPLFTEILAQKRAHIETFIRAVYDTCGLMLTRVTVHPLTFLFLYLARDAFKREGRKLQRLFRDFFQHCSTPVSKVGLQIRRLGSHFAACRLFTHLNFVEGKGEDGDKMLTKADKSRFASIEKEITEQGELMEKNFSFLRNQSDTFRTALYKALKLLKEKKGQTEEQEVTSMDDLDVISESPSFSTDDFITQSESERSISIEGARSQGPTGSAPASVMEGQTAQASTETRNKSHKESEGVFQQQSKSLASFKLSETFTFPKDIPSSSVEDYRKTQRDTGVSKDEIDPSEDSDDIRQIIMSTLIRQRDRALRAPVYKHKAGSTTYSRESILNLLSNQAFIGDSGDNASLWFGIPEALHAERGVISKSGLDTVVCIHTSEGLEEWAYQEVKEIVLTLLGGLEDVASKHRYSENVGLVAPGGKTPVVQHLSKNYDGLRAAMDKINPMGEASLEKALIFSLACLTGSGLCTYGSLRIAPRLIIMTDGVKSNDFNDAEKKKRLFSTVRAIGGDHIRKTLFGPVIWIPTGKADKDLIKHMAEVSNGVYLEGKDILGLCSYHKIKRVSADVLAYMQALGVDPQDLHFAEAFEACGQDLDHDEKYTVANFVANKLCRINRELGEMDNFNNIVLHDDLPPLGSRVVRGPDWKQDDQDSGLPGTIVNHGQNGETIWVLWDSNMCGRYGYSKNTGYDVLVTDEPRRLQCQNLMEIGMQVERGPDWHYENEDGGSNSRGVVIRRKGAMFKVRWDNGSIHDYQFCEEKFEIWVRSPSEPGNRYR